MKRKVLSFVALSMFFAVTSYAQTNNNSEKANPKEAKNETVKAANASNASATGTENGAGNQEVIVEKPNITPSKPLGNSNSNNAPHNGAETLENSAPPK